MNNDMIPGVALIGFGLLWFLAIRYRWSFLLSATKIKWGRDAFGERGSTCLDYLFAVSCVVSGLILIMSNLEG